MLLQNLVYFCYLSSSGGGKDNYVWGGKFMFHLERGRPVHGLLVCFTGTCKQLFAIYKSNSVRKSWTMVWGLTGTKAPNNSLLISEHCFDHAGAAARIDAEEFSVIDDDVPMRTYLSNDPMSDNSLLLERQAIQLATLYSD